MLALVVFFTFLLRYSAADTNSYWLDELYSVERYTLAFATVREALASLAETSIHPPLYQFVLYHWIETFGDGEVATRTLSNIYMSVATISLHRLLRVISTRSTANAATLVFALSFGVMYYGLETRSYAQTLMFSVVSSYSLLLWIRDCRYKYSLRRTVFTIPFAVFNIASLGLLFTHYFNFFFWVGQALVGIVLLVAWTSRKHRVWPCSALLFGYVLQAAIFVLIWGRITIRSYGRMEESYATPTPETSPIDIVLAIVNETFELRFLSAGLALSLALVIATLSMAIHVRMGSRGDATRWELVGFAYIVGVCFLPALAAYSFFLTVQVERFSSRYVLYLLPSIVAIFALAGRAVYHAIFKLARERLTVHRWRSIARHAYLPAVLVVVSLLVAPGAIRASSETKADWRGISERVVAVIEGDRDREYLIYETSFRSTPMLDYYLRRFANDIAVHGTIRRFEERRGGDFAFERDPALEHADRLVVVFSHQMTSGFPNALRTLDDMFTLEVSQIDRGGRGFLVYDTAPEG